MTRVTSLLLAGSLLWAQNAQEIVAKGVEQFHKGEYRAALETLERARKLSPDDARARTFLALTRAALGDCAQAVNELKQQWEKVSDPPLRRLAGLGAVQCLLAADNLGALMPILLQLKAAYPDDADVLYESAKVFNKAWNATLQEMFQKTPASYRVNQISAEVFETQHRYGEAAAEYRKAIEKNSSALNLHFRLGRVILLESHEHQALQEARRQFEAELTLNPSDAVSEYEIGQILVAEQQPMQAAAHFQKAIDLTPRFAEALVAMGKIHTDARRYEDAIKLLRRAVEAQPRMEAAHYALMLAYRDAGQREQAQREKTELDKLQKPPEGEFTDFLKKLGEKAPKQ